MNRSMQWRQEARPLAWPWILTLAAGILAIAFPVERNSVADIAGEASLWRQLAELILPVGTFFAIPLIATLTIGNEFQHRTLALRLSQPLPREIFWQQKVLTAIAAVVPLAILYGIALNLRFGRAFLLVALIWIVLTTAAAVPFTFLARSTIGGMVLSAWVYAFVAYGWVYFENHGAFRRPWLWLISAAVLAYAVAMMWLGRRMVLRYQATEGGLGESFAPGAQLVPAFVAEWFRCRAAQPMLNLVRREFHLLRTLWTLCALCTTAWAFIVSFNILPHGDDRGSMAKGFLLGMTVIFTMLLAHLAGTLSLSEEKVIATHAWQLTMPISPTTQWLVKLGVALYSSLLFAYAVPMALLRFGGELRGNADLYVSGSSLWVWPLTIAAITIISFWCACIGKGAVRATIWTFALLALAAIVLEVENSFGYLAWQKWPGSLASHFDPFELARFFRLDQIGIFGSLFFVGLALPFLTVLLQSRRLFSSQPEDALRTFARNAAPLLFCLVAPSFLIGMWFSFLIEGMQQKDAILKNLHTAIEAKLLATTEATPQNFTADALNLVAPLSGPTRKWLGNATITTQIEPYSPNLASAATHGRWQVAFGEQGKRPVPYLATIRTGDGKHTCTLKFTVGEHTSSGVMQTLCDGE